MNVRQRLTKSFMSFTLLTKEEFDTHGKKLAYYIELSKKQEIKE